MTAKKLHLSGVFPLAAEKSEYLFRRQGKTQLLFFAKPKGLRGVFRTTYDDRQHLLLQWYLQLYRLFLLHNSSPFHQAAQITPPVISIPNSETPA